MKKNICALALAVAGSMLLTGCQFSNKSSLLLPTAPSTSSASSANSSSSSTSSSSSSAATVPAAAGTWASSAINGLPNLGSCSNLQWQISSLSETSVAGTVSALCGGVVTVTANLTGQMSGSDVVLLTANGSAVGLGITCPFNLDGTGHIQSSDAMLLDYSGTTCAGPVSGSQMLHRRAPAPQSPSTPDPQPEPPPPAYDDGVFGCPTNDHYQLVVCVHDHVNPHDTDSAFEVSKRVAWGLRGEGAGLLIKNGGENVTSWKSYNFSASRICYPDGHIFKVISDAGPGGANGASWQDNGYVDRSLYLPALDPTN